MGRTTYEKYEYGWVKQYLDKGICPVCKHKKVRGNLKSCSPPCNDIYWKHCVVVHDWNVLRSEVFKRDGRKCKICQNTENLEIDHIKAVGLGGDEWSIDNLQVLCRQCHKIKSKDDIDMITYERRKKLGI